MADDDATVSNGNATPGAAMLSVLQSLHAPRARPRVVALIRHSARHYGRTENDLDNPLSDLGRTLCREFGAALPRWQAFGTLSSSAGRCIETAELIGASHAHPRATENRTLEALAAFYVRDMRRVGGMMKHLSPQETLRRWFAGELPSEVMTQPGEAAERIAAAIVGLLRSAPDDSLTLCVSHDWSIYLLRHMVLELLYGEHPPAEYLDGFAFWFDGDALVVSSALCGVRRIATWPGVGG
jgi:broad specificity phosphatase PhoE